MQHKNRFSVCRFRINPPKRDPLSYGVSKALTFKFVRAKPSQTLRVIFAILQMRVWQAGNKRIFHSSYETQNKIIDETKALNTPFIFIRKPKENSKMTCLKQNRSFCAMWRLEMAVTCASIMNDWALEAWKVKHTVNYRVTRTATSIEKMP